MGCVFIRWFVIGTLLLLSGLLQFIKVFCAVGYKSIFQRNRTVSQEIDLVVLKPVQNDNHDGAPGIERDGNSNMREPGSRPPTSSRNRPKNVALHMVRCFFFIWNLLPNLVFLYCSTLTHVPLTENMVMIEYMILLGLVNSLVAMLYDAFQETKWLQCMYYVTYVLVFLYECLASEMTKCPAETTELDILILVTGVTAGLLALAHFVLCLRSSDTGLKILRRHAFISYYFYMFMMANGIFILVSFMYHYIGFNTFLAYILFVIILTVVPTGYFFIKPAVSTQ